MAETTIEWTNKTWNPLRGCSRLSEGCRNCYAERIAARFCAPGEPFEGFAKRTAGGPRWTGKVELVREHLADPLKWRRPARVFVNSMSDLFHESLPDDAIDEVFGVMHACEYLGAEGVPGHTFQVLTKRAERMAAYFGEDRRQRWADAALRHAGGRDPDGLHDQIRFRKVPHPRIWLGVSVENQEAADERTPHLLQVPASVRFLSCEPLLGRLQLDTYLGELPEDEDGAPYPERVDWVIVGGESGPGARPCGMEWISSVVRQCQGAGVPVFVKQLGAYVVSEERTFPADGMARPDQLKPTDYAPNGEVWAWRAGLQNRKGGDPAEWPAELHIRQFPEVTR